MACFFALLLLAAFVGQGREKQVIAYVSAPHHTPHRIFLMDINAGLSAQANDIWAASTACCLSWSPDGRYLAFPGRDNTGFTEIYIMDADGQNAHLLIPQSDWLDQSNPSWSPDSQTVVFTANQGANQVSVLLVDRVTGALRQLAARSVYNSRVSWSSDGARLIFAANVFDAPFYQIMMVEADGADLHALTPGFWDDTTPEFSPDGTRIVFVSTRVGANRQQIYVMNADSTTPTRLTNTRSSEYNPHWSPDGTQIVFTSTRDGNPQVYVINANGTHERRLTHTRFDSYGAVWSPDGTQILFASNRDGNPELYVIHADGTGEHRLTVNTWGDTLPVWQPDGSG